MMMKAMAIITCLADTGLFYLRKCTNTDQSQASDSIEISFAVAIINIPCISLEYNKI